MDQRLAALFVAFGLISAAPAQAKVDGFTIVNQTGAAVRDIAVRRVGDSKWVAIAAEPAVGEGARSTFSDPDCAFDIRATVAGVGPVTWGGVNLCDVKSVTLNRDRSGRSWVDYD